MYKALLDKIVKIFEINPNTTNDGLDLAFELLSSSIAFNKSPFFIRENCWNILESNSGVNANGQDGKIDSYNVYQNKERIVIDLLQAKNTNQIKLNDISGYFTSVDNYIVKLLRNLPDGYKSLGNVQEKIDECLLRYPRHSVKYNVYVAAHEFDSQLKSNIIQIFDNTFGNNDVELFFVDTTLIESKIEDIRDMITKEKFNKSRTKISFAQTTECRNEGESKILVGIINSKEVINIINDEFENNFDLSRLFSGNVRGFLGSTYVNDQIKSTIIKTPKKFLSLNNGAVLLCDKIEPRELNTYVIENAVIINGQQTFASIYKYAKSNTIMEKINIQVKVIEISEKYRVIAQNEISRSSNQANTIDDMDLLSNKPLIKAVRQFFWSKGLYLSVKEGETLNDLFFDNSEKVGVIDIIKMWVSIYLKRPNDGKTTKKNIKIFIEAYDGIEPYNKLVETKNHTAMCEMFYNSFLAMKILSEFSNHYKHESFFDHAKYFIMFLICQTKGFDFMSFNQNDFDEIIDIVKKCIAIEVERKGTDYTHNNYFKSSRPITDYSQQPLKTIKQAIKEIF